MRQMNTYTVLCTVQITHEFYEDRLLPLYLMPDRQTQQLFVNRDIILKKMTANQYVLLKSETSFLPAEEFIFSFDIRVDRDDFYYVTQQKPQEVEGLFTLEDSDKPTVWKNLKVMLKTMQNSEEAKVYLQIQSLQKHFEFIFIPKYTTGDILLRVAEEKNKIQFTKPEQIVLFDNTQVYRTVSEEAIPLKKKAEYNVMLWEERSPVERLMSKYIPLPDVRNISVINPADTITSYYYF